MNRKNITSNNPNEKLWHEQKELSGYLPYVFGFEKIRRIDYKWLHLSSNRANARIGGN